jgi:hypothetical protein
VVATRDEREFYRAKVEREGRRYQPALLFPLERIPANKPHIKLLKADRNARIWVELYQPAQKAVIDTTTQWVEKLVYDVFETTGEFIGRVHLPANSSFATAQADKLWVIQRDSLNVPTIVRYSMRFAARR